MSFEIEIQIFLGMPIYMLQLKFCGNVIHLCHAPSELEGTFELSDYEFNSHSGPIYPLFRSFALINPKSVFVRRSKSNWGWCLTLLISLFDVYSNGSLCASCKLLCNSPQLALPLVKCLLYFGRRMA